MKIEFVEPTPPSRRAWIVAGILWLVVLVLGGLNLHMRAQATRQRELQLAAEQRAKAPVLPAAPHASPPYQAEAEAALKRAALPEAEALAELEHVAVVGIQLRSIDVNPAASVVVVELEATNDEILGDYLDQLNAGMPTPRWHIQRIATASGVSATSPGALRSAVIARDI